MGTRASARWRWAQVLGVALALAACDDSSTGVQTHYASEPFEYKVDVADRLRLHVVGINGGVEIAGAAQLDSFVVAGERRVGSSSVEDAQEHLESLQVLIDETSPEDLLVRTEHPATPGNRNYVVEYDVLVPDDMETRVHNTNGNISARAFHHRLILVTTNGSIQVEETQADIAARTINGAIEANVSIGSGGVLNLVATNGDITVRVPASTSARLSAGIVNGRIDVSGLTLHDVEQTSSSLDARLGDGDGTIFVRTANGRIHIVGI